MLDTDRPDFVRGLDELAQVFRCDLSRTQVASYWKALRTLPLPSFRQGVDACVRESKFMPSPSEIRERSGANNPAYAASTSAPRLVPGSSFDNLGEEALREHVRLLRRGIELMAEGGSDLALVLEPARARLRLREEELEDRFGGGWDS